MDQFWKLFQDTGTIPVIGQKMGRPKKPITPGESEIIDKVYHRFRYGAHMLEILIQSANEATISHNRIQRYLMDRGFAKAEVSKRKQRKWVRYERKHSISAGHIDWHHDGNSRLKICAVLDDSSRKILAIVNLPLPIQKIQSRFSVVRFGNIGLSAHFVN